MAGDRPDEASAFREISSRGKIAFSVACLEELAIRQDLDGERFDDLVEMLWRPVAAPPGSWRTAEIPRSLADVGALFSCEPLPEKTELVREGLEHTWNVRECLMDPSPRTRERANEFLAEWSRLLARTGARIPSPEFFHERSPREAGGYGELGRAAPPAFFREGIAWEDVEPALRRGLCSVSVHRRREAAFAAAHMGLPSQAIERVLARTCHDPDPEVRTLSLQAWRRLFTNPLDETIPPPLYFHDVPDHRDYIHRRRSRWARSSAPPMPTPQSLETDDRDARVRAVEHAGRLLVDSPELAERLDALVARDPFFEVRRVAAIWLSEAPFTDSRLGVLVSALQREEDLLTRAALLFTIGVWGPRSAPAVPAILQCLSLVVHPAYDASAFYATEALEAIGAAGYDAILRAITSGNQSRTEWWLRSLALRPDLREALVEELARRTAADEPWLETRYRRAIGILRMTDR